VACTSPLLAAVQELRLRHRTSTVIRSSLFGTLGGGGDHARNRLQPALATVSLSPSGSWPHLAGSLAGGGQHAMGRICSIWARGILAETDLIGEVFSSIASSRK
jgi:hypothetical protein